MKRAGFEPMTMSAQAVGPFVTAESPKWLEVAKTSGVKGD